MLGGKDVGVLEKKKGSHCVSSVFQNWGQRTGAQGRSRTNSCEDWQVWRKPSAKDKALAGTVSGGAEDSPEPTGMLCRKCPFSSDCLFDCEPGVIAVCSHKTQDSRTISWFNLSTREVCSLRIYSVLTGLMQWLLPLRKSLQTVTVLSLWGTVVQGKGPLVNSAMTVDHLFFLLTGWPREEHCLLRHKHMIIKVAAPFGPWLSSEGGGKSRNRNFPSRCARRGESLSVLRGQNTALNFKGRCPQGPQQTHSTKMFDELPWQASTVQINDWKSLVYVSVEEDKFSLGFGNLRDWETQLTTAPMPSFTMLYHGSFTFYIPFQRVFINLSETDSMSVFCFFCNTMATKWLEIVFGLV